jgi:hypothetical protein
MLISVLPASGATVRGRLVDGLGNPTSPVLIFKPDAISADGTNTIVDVERKVTPTNGVFSLTLQGGSYTVTFGNSARTISLQVPLGDTNVYEMNSLGGTNLQTFTYTNFLGQIAWRVRVGDGLAVVTNVAGGAFERVTITPAGVTTNVVVSGVGTLLITNGVVMGIGP